MADTHAAHTKSGIAPLLMALFAGALFGTGLAWASMTDPMKVLNFLDVTGHWDPSLAFVMGGAVGVTLPGFAWVMRRARPWWAARFHLPRVTTVDRRLCLGAALFGIGWGMTGYCPGPALATVGAGNSELWWFLPAMLAGGALERWMRRP